MAMQVPFQTIDSATTALDSSLQEVCNSQVGLSGVGI